MKSFLFYHATSQASVVIITIALMLFVGYLMTRITRKFKLPNVTGYILAGILMGPYCLDMVPVKVIDGMDFLSDIARSFRDWWFPGGKYLKTDPDQWGSTGVRRYFWLAVKMHDAKEKIQRQPADHIGGSAVCFLRDLFSGRCIPSSGMYVHGNHLY